jgi:hypothetical protein
MPYAFASHYNMSLNRSSTKLSPVADTQFKIAHTDAFAHIMSLPHMLLLLP